MIPYYLVTGLLAYLLFRKDPASPSKSNADSEHNKKSHFVFALALVLVLPVFLYIFVVFLIGGNPSLNKTTLILFPHIYSFVLLSIFLSFYVHQRKKAIAFIAAAASLHAITDYSYTAQIFPFTQTPSIEQLTYSAPNLSAQHKPGDTVSLKVRTHLPYPVIARLKRNIAWPETPERKTGTRWATSVSYPTQVLWPFKENTITVTLNDALCETYLIFSTNGYSGFDGRSYDPCPNDTVHTGDYTLSLSLLAWKGPNRQPSEDLHIGNLTIRDDQDETKQRYLPHGWTPKNYYDVYALEKLNAHAQALTQDHAEIKGLPAVGRNTPKWVLGPVVSYEDNHLCGVYSARTPLKGQLKACLKLKNEPGVHPYYTPQDITVTLDTIDSTGLPTEEDLRTIAQQTLTSYMKWRRDTGQTLIAYNMKPIKVTPAVLLTNHVRGATYTFEQSNRQSWHSQAIIDIIIDFDKSACVKAPALHTHMRNAPCVFETSPSPENVPD